MINLNQEMNLEKLEYIFFFLVGEAQLKFDLIDSLIFLYYFLRFCMYVYVYCFSKYISFID